MTGADLMSWQLDEHGAAAYERNLVGVFMDAWAVDLVQAVDLRAAERVLDVACGTGIVARRAAEVVGAQGAVTGVDVNPAMLAVARTTTAALDPPIRLEEVGADALPFADASFDVVLCQQGLQFFPDRAAALAELLRVTRPGGRLGLSTCRFAEHQTGHLALIDVLTRHVGVQAGEVVRSPYGLGDPAELRALLTEAGFRDVSLRIAVWAARFPSAHALLTAETASSPLGALVDELDADVRQALLDDLAAALRPHTDDHGVVFPFQTLVVTATR